MVIWPEIRMGQYRDGEHREDAPHLIKFISISYNLKSFSEEEKRIPIQWEFGSEFGAEQTREYNFEKTKSRR